MTIDQFWEIIEQVKRDSGGDFRRKCDLLATQLSRLSFEELLSFDEHFSNCMNRAYSRSLWAAAFVIGDGGCGDDGFMDFRSTLISMGRTAFERALDDPETLVDVVPPGGNLRHEGFQAVALHVAARLSRDGELDRARGSHNFLESPSGEDWDEFTVWDMYPRLTKRFSPD